jgi:succinate dehydrogenase cytochrome b subunit
MKTYPKDWLSRRWHSLLGLWLVVFIVEHLVTNSQAALLIGNDGAGFIRAVNALHNLPYLQAIELGLLGVPILYHAIYGIKYAFTARFNSRQSDGSKPDLSRYGGNHAFTWQRLASWVLLVGILLHVFQMRFMDYPESKLVGGTESEYAVRIHADKGLDTLAPRLGAKLYDQMPEWVTGKPLKKGQVIAVTEQFGAAVLLTVRDTFKDPWMMILYTIFVLAAVYHAFRGLWSFMIVWGVSLTPRSQALASRMSIGLMMLLGALGMAAIWLTYLVNLRS